MPVNLPANGEERRGERGEEKRRERERGRACAQTPRLFFLFDSSHPSSHYRARYIFPLSIEIYYSTEHTRRYEGTVAVRLRGKGNLEPRSGYQPTLAPSPAFSRRIPHQPRDQPLSTANVDTRRTPDRWTSLSFSSQHNIASLTGERAERKNLIGVYSPRGPSSSCSHLSRPLSFRSTI